MSFFMKTLAKEVLSKYPCSVHICINPYYWEDNGSICGLGLFQPYEVERLSKVLEEISAQIYRETGFYIADLSWLDIFPEDKSLLDVRMKEATESLETLLSSL